MSKRLSTILLLVSLSLNAGIIGGLVVMGIFRQNHYIHNDWQRPAGPPSEEREGFNHRDLEDSNVRDLRDKFQDSRAELMRELAKDPIDEAKINVIIDKSIAAQSTFEKALGAKLIELRKTMNAEEAKERFSKHMNRRNRTNNRRNHP